MTTNETPTRKVRDLKPGMTLNGGEIEKVRHGVGSGKGWVFLTYTDGTGARYRGARDVRDGQLR